MSMYDKLNLWTMICSYDELRAFKGVPWWLSRLKIQHCHCCGSGLILAWVWPKEKSRGVPVVAQQVKNQTQCLWGCGFDPWSCSVGWGSGVAVSCGIGRRCGSDLILLWLWLRPAPTAPIRPPAWESPYAVGVALKRQKTKKKKKKNPRKIQPYIFPFSVF